MKKAYVTIAAAAISVAILLGATFASFHLTQGPLPITRTVLYCPTKTAERSLPLPNPKRRTKSLCRPRSQKPTFPSSPFPKTNMCVPR